MGSASARRHAAGRGGGDTGPSPRPRLRPAAGTRLPAAERRARILRAFVRETLARGSVRRVGMRAVAERAGCTAPVLYRLFDGRDALVRAAIRSTHAPLLERMESVARGGGSAAERIRALGERYLADEPGEDEAFESLVFTECASDPALAREVRGVFTRFEALLGEVIRSGMAAGELRADVDPVYAAWRLIDVGLFRNQARLMRLATPDRIDYGRRAVESLLREISPS